MPPLSRWMVRLALLHLGAGSVLGGLLLVEKATGALPALWAWRAAHLDEMLLGGMVQLALGVALWMLPRANARPAQAPVGAAAAVLLNVSVLVAVAGSVGGIAGAVLAGRVGVVLAAVTFAALLVPRVRAARTHAPLPSSPPASA